MSGTGYDYSVVQFSPEGRVYQIEYAEKASDKGDTVIAIKCTDGVVLGLEKTVSSKLLKPGANPRLLPISPSAAMGISGLHPDGRALANEAKSIIRDYEKQYGTEIPNQVLAHRVAGKVHNSTVYGNERPYGCSAVIAAYNPEDGPQVYMVTPAAQCYRYFAISTGKHTQGANTELEKTNFQTVTCNEAVELIAMILYKLHDDVKDKEFEYEALWINKDSNWKIQTVPADFMKQVVDNAKEAKRKALMEDDEEDQ